MGNSSAKESRSSNGADSRSNASRPSTHAGASELSSPAQGGPGRNLQNPQSIRAARRHDVTFFGLAGLTDGTAAEPRRETKQERDARRAERERVSRAKERERSLREEGVDGGYMVTLGTYTGPEDFSKGTVRQLMIERRLAPFWRGLNDHSESWTEHQLVAAARGQRIPAPDEIPQEESSPSTPNTELSPPKPIAGRGYGYTQNDTPSTFFASHHFPQSFSGSASTPTESSSPLFRGRSRTLASLSSKNDSQTELTKPEIKLPHQPQINGQPVEAYLYKDVSECPICFLYYPPYLNQTRCCDQPICSECFVQIKRPDPHPPEHLDPNSPPSPEAVRQEEEGILISEPSSCPFCKQTEFGVTYEPPPFRRGLSYAKQAPSAMSPPRSSPSSGSGFTRKRGQSVSATDASVITTDMVRPDWAKKLADARAQAARRSAAATALHTAAYMTNNNGPDERATFGRRRRHLSNTDNNGSSDDNAPRMAGSGAPIPNMELLMAALEGQSSSRGRRMHGGDMSQSEYGNPRGSRTDELEDLMMMEAIRQSLAAEEERKRKEEKESAKEAKKEEKKKAKEQKKADKAAKKQPLYSSGSANASSVLAGPSSPAEGATASTPTDDGKGKARATPISDKAPSLNTLGFSILDEPTSTLNMDFGSSSKTTEQASSSSIAKSTAPRQPESDNATTSSPLTTPPQPTFSTTSTTAANSATAQGALASLPNPRSRLRQLSDASSSSSSFVESPLGSVRNEHTGTTSSYNASPNTSGHHLPSEAQAHSQDSSGNSGDNGTPTPTNTTSAGTDSSFNFGSLAAMIGTEDAAGGGSSSGKNDGIATTPTATATTVDERFAPVEATSSGNEAAGR